MKLKDIKKLPNTIKLEDIIKLMDEETDKIGITIECDIDITDCSEFKENK